MIDLAKTKPTEMTELAIAADAPKKSRKKSDATRVMDLINNQYDIVESSANSFKTGCVFAINKETHEARLVGSGDFNKLVEHLCYWDAGFLPQPQALKQVIEVLQAGALFHDDADSLQQVDIHIGTARTYERGLGKYMSDDGYVIHLDTRDKTGGVYTLWDGDWHYGDDSIHFYRPSGFLPLIKAEGHDLKGLEDLCNMFPQVSRDEMTLVIGFIIMPWLFEKSGGFPILQIVAAAGSGKTRFRNEILGLVDPETDPGMDLPKNAQDILVASMNHRVFTYDNVNTIKPTQSSLLCRVTTGDGFAQRRLYSNTDEVRVEADAPIITTAVDPGDEPQDLLSRSVILHLHTISQDQMKGDDDLDNTFNEKKAHIMGSLLTLAAKVAQIIFGKPVKTDKTRLADYSAILHAIDAITKNDPDVNPTNGLNTYLNQMNASLVESAADDPVYVALQELHQQGLFNHFTGKSSDLYKRGTQLYDAVQNAYMNEGCGREPPRSAISFGRRLSNLSTALKAEGWQIEHQYSTSRKDHNAIIWDITEPNPFHIPTDSKLSDSKQPSLPVDDPDDPAF